MTNTFTAFRADIEGLRAIAVILVVIFHADLGVLHGGFVGVDIFFAISGYLITGLILAEHEKTGRLDFLNFYARRGRRLIPAATAMVAMVLVVGFFIYSPDELFEVAKSGAASSVYMSNMYFASQTFGYFSSHMAANPFLHTWSLSVEEQFYLFWPLFVFLCAKYTRQRLGLLMALGAMTLGSFVFGLWLVATDLNWGFYALPGRVWEFSLGGLARVLIFDAGRLPKLGRALIGWTGLALIGGSSVLLTQWIRFPGWPALLPVLGTVMILAVGGQSSWLDKALGARPLQWIGQRSYAIYLWHWPLLLLPVVWFGEPTDLHKLAYLAGAVLLAHISYHLVENPVRRHPWLVGRKFASLGLTAGFAVIAGAIAVTTYVGAKFEDRDPAYQEYRDARYQRAAELDAHPDCLVWPTKLTGVEVCPFASEGSRGTIVLAGDSHANHWFSPILETAQDHAYQLSTVMKTSCAFVDVDVYDVVERRKYHECRIWREQAIEEIIGLQPDLAIISMASGSNVARSLPWGDTNLGVSRAEWGEGLARALKPLTDAGVPVLLIQHTPKLFGNGPICLARTVKFGRSPDICARDRDHAIDQEILDVERAALANMPGVSIVDFTDLFCDAERCDAKRAGISMYSDAHHLSEAWARSLKPHVEAAVLGAMSAKNPAR